MGAAGRHRDGPWSIPLSPRVPRTIPHPQFGLRHLSNVYLDGEGQPSYLPDEDEEDDDCSEDYSNAAPASSVATDTAVS